MKATYEKFLEWLNAAEESHYEYETEHLDAGGAYSHLIREGDTIALSKRLDAFCKEYLEISLDESDLDSLLDAVIDRAEYGDEDTIHSGHIFSGNGEPDWFHLDAFPVGEIESQYCFDDSYVSPDTPRHLLRAFFLKAEKDREICARVSDTDCLTYQSTDCVWIYRIHRDEIREMIQEIQSEGD